MSESSHRPPDHDFWLCPDQIFDGATLRNGVLHVVGGRVTDIADAAPQGAAIRTLRGLITPGFLDLQVNGGGGVLFNADPTPEGIARIIAAHRQFGTVGILPTVITDAPEVLAAAVEALLAAQEQPGVLGIHIEGPHISVPRRGTHAERFVRPMEPATMADVSRLRAAGLPVMITVAPEAVTAAQITALAATGAIVSIGHSDATADETRAALDAGASCFTHLFNAMSPMLNRAPGVAGAAISSTAHAGFICDGIHVADEVLAIAIRARPLPDRMFLVSDAMPTVGGPDHFRLYGNDLHLQDGMLVNAEGSLAGAHVTQAEGVARLIGHLHVPPTEALKMAISIPATVIGRPDLARVADRDTDDLLHIPEFPPRVGQAMALESLTQALRSAQVSKAE